MDPIAVLMEEHRVIEVVLGCLRKMSDYTTTTGQVEGASARKAIEFFRMFADQCHHGKEETYFFPFVESLGFPREGGPTGVMLAEHEEGRALVREMAAAVSAAERGETSGGEDFVFAADRFVALLSSHIEKEDHCLFSMARDRMSPEDAQFLAAQFAAAGREIGEGTHEGYRRLADELAETFGVAKAQGVFEDAWTFSCGH